MKDECTYRRPPVHPSSFILPFLADTWRLTAIHNAELDAAAGQIAAPLAPQADDTG